MTLDGTLALESSLSSGTLLAASLSAQAPADFVSLSDVTAEDVSAAAAAALAGPPAYAVLGQTLGTPNLGAILRMLK